MGIKMTSSALAEKQQNLSETSFPKEIKPNTSLETNLSNTTAKVTCRLFLGEMKYKERPWSAPKVLKSIFADIRLDGKDGSFRYGDDDSSISHEFAREI